jgi:hypothetical protein
MSKSNERDLIPEGLPQLTKKQHAFVHAILRGETAADAYRGAYNASAMTNRTIWAEASRLRANPKVSAWLRYFQRMGLDEARISLEGHLAELARARELALALGQAAAAVQAEHLRGKALGLYEDQIRITIDMTDTELLQAIEAVLGREAKEIIGAALGGSEPKKIE